MATRNSLSFMEKLHREFILQDELQEFGMIRLFKLVVTPVARPFVLPLIFLGVITTIVIVLKIIRTAALNPVKSLRIE